MNSELKIGCIDSGITVKGKWLTYITFYLDGKRPIETTKLFENEDQIKIHCDMVKIILIDDESMNTVSRVSMSKKGGYPTSKYMADILSRMKCCNFQILKQLEKDGYI